MEMTVFLGGGSILNTDKLTSAEGGKISRNDGSDFWSDDTAINDAKHITVEHPGGRGWKLAYVGMKHTIAIDDDYKLWAWEGNVQGRHLDGTVMDHNHPLQIEPDTTWISSSVCEYNTIAIRANGSLWTWESSEFYLHGKRNTVSYPNPIQIGTDADWVSVVADESYNIFGKRKDGSVWSWIGDGQNKNAPRKIAPKH